MPLYEYEKNAENIIRVSEKVKDSVTMGKQKVVYSILEECQKYYSKTGRTALVALEGWYGVEWETILEAINTQGKELDISAGLIARAAYTNKLSKLFV